MTKTYTDELAEWVNKRANKCREKNLVGFLAVRDDVKAAIEVGYSTKTIWANMHECGRVGIGYEMFLHFVNRLIKKDRNAKPGHQCAESIVATTVAPPGWSAEPNGKPATAAKRAGMPTFKFNPVPRSREELK